MKRLVVVLALILAGAGLLYLFLTGDQLTQKERAWIERHGVVKVAYTNDYPPLNFVDPNGKAHGISIDYWRLLADKLGFEVEFHSGSRLNQQLDGLKNGRYDSLAGIIPSEEHAEYFDFTPPYMNVNTYIFVKSHHNHAKGKDMADLKIGVVRGSKYAWIRAAGIRPRTYPNYTDTILALVKDKVGAIVMDEPVVGYITSQFEFEEKIARGGLVDQGRMVLAVKKGNKLLLDILNRGVAAISPEEIREISIKWFTSAPLCKECVAKFGSFNR